MHLVHYNEVYDNISQAVAEGMGNGLAVVGIFLKEVTDWDQEMNVKDSATVNSLRKGAMELAKPWYGPTAPTVDIELRLIEFISAIRLTIFFSGIDGDFQFNTILRFSDLTGLYHYEGGLTTPGCAEIVEWLVLDKPLLIRQNGLVSIHHHHQQCMRAY